jgi:hypothetical protein
MSEYDIRVTQAQQRAPKYRWRGASEDAADTGGLPRSNARDELSCVDHPMRLHTRSAGGAGGSARVNRQRGDLEPELFVRLYGFVESCPLGDEAPLPPVFEQGGFPFGRAGTIATIPVVVASHVRFW